MRAKPYSSGAAALVFICSIIRVVAPSYEVDGICGRWIPCSRSLPSFIKEGEVGLQRAIGLINCFSSLLQQIDPSHRLDTLALVCLDLHIG